MADGQDGSLFTEAVAAVAAAGTILGGLFAKKKIEERLETNQSQNAQRCHGCIALEEKMKEMEKALKDLSDAQIRMDERHKAVCLDVKDIKEDQKAIHARITETAQKTAQILGILSAQQGS